MSKNGFLKKVLRKKSGFLTSYHKAVNTKKIILKLLLKIIFRKIKCKEKQFRNFSRHSIMDAFLVQKSSEIFSCNFCDYHTSRKSQYDRHITTLKHQKNAQGCTKKFQLNHDIFICECGNKYKFRQGLQKHRKLCCKTNDKTNEKMVELFKEQLQENKEMKQFLLEQQKQMMEQNKQILELTKDKTTQIINNNCHTTNKFNLNLFLNEHCKNALNLADFINSLQLQLTDLEATAKLGYVDGISKIFVKGLKDLELHKRPVHCSDVKRETLYVKDENKWEKEDENNVKIKNAIQQITYKNIKQIPAWVENHPSCKNGSSQTNDEYMNILSNCMTGTSEEEQKSNMNKIISKVAREVAIQKD